MVSMLKDYENKILEKVRLDLDSVQFFLILHQKNFALMYLSSAMRELEKLSKVREMLEEFA